MKFNPQIVKKGFNKLYTEVLKVSLPEKTWKNLLFVFGKIEEDDYWNDLRQVANFLAQCGHESAWKYAPISEFRAKEGTRVREIQDNYWNTGFYGRGLVQITHETNYRKLSKYVGLDLVKNPNLALNPEVSYTIAAKGMQLGLFTGKRLSDYINKSKCDYYNARRIVNGTDRADEISYYSKCIEVILKSASIKEDQYVPIAPKISEEPFVIEESDSKTKITTTTETSTPQTTTVVEVEKSIPAPTQQVEPVIPRITSGIKAWKATLSGILGSLGLGGAWSWISEKYQSLQQHTNLIMVTLIIAALFGLVFYIMRERSKEKREQRAHELTMEQLKIRANPTLTNVEIRQ